MELNNQQTQLLEFVKQLHGEQKRKYTREPYWTHPLAVAKLVHENTNESIFGVGVEIALCHDLLEDTKCTADELDKALADLSYSDIDRAIIVISVQQLTDEFTSEKYPNLNRATRKTKECSRLGQASFTAQTVKYADLIDNTSSIVEFDPAFAKTYLKEKLQILNKMRGGNINLLVLCCHTLHEAQRKLKTTNPQ